MADVIELTFLANTTQLDKAIKKTNSFERQIKALALAESKGKITTQQYEQRVSELATEFQRLAKGNIQARNAINNYSKTVYQATKAVDAHNQVLARSNMIVQGTGLATQQTARKTNQLGVLFQQTGYQVGDFAVQVQSGTNVMVALGQQATQLVGTFGMLSKSTKAIALFAGLGVVIPIFTALAGAVMRTAEGSEGASRAMTELKQVLEPISPLLSAISGAARIVADTFIEFANFVVNNLDRIAVAAGLVATFFAGKFLTAFLLAGGAVKALTLGAKLLRVALIRLPFVALVVGATELALALIKLVKGAGGFGNALRLLVGVASGVWTDIVNGASGLWHVLMGVSKSIQASFVSAFAVIGEKWDTLVNGMAKAWNSIAGTAFGKTLGFGVMGESDVGGRLSSSAAGLEEEALASIEKGSSLLKSARNLEKTSEAWGKLKEAMAKADEEGERIDIRDWFGGAVDGQDADKGAADKAKDALTEMQERVQSLADTIKSSMSEAFMSMVEGTKSAKDAFRDMARAIIKQLFDILVVQQIVGSFDAKTGVGSGVVGAIMGAFTNGAAFSGGKVTAFADGGVVSKPTLFPMANGVGLMGEAGPEAIMPLKRGANGKLGVQVEGSQQPVVINQSFNFSANGDDSVKRIIAQEAPKIANLTQKQILDQRARGGAFRTTFG